MSARASPFSEGLTGARRSLLGWFTWLLVEGLSFWLLAGGFALEPLYRILECPHDVTAGERASDPRERALEPQYLFWSQKSLAITFSVLFWSHRWAWYSVGGDYARILRRHLGWRLITTLHEPTPASLLLMSLNGLLLRPKSWESSLTLSSHILIQSVSKSCQLIFRLP